MRKRIIALCVVCAVLVLSVGCVHSPRQEQNDSMSLSETAITQQELPTVSTTQPTVTQTVATQVSAVESQSEKSVSASSALTPTNADFDMLGKLTLFYGLDRTSYDCEKDSFLKLLTQNIASSGSADGDPYGLIQDDDCHFYMTEYIETPNGLQRVASDPQHRLDCNGYFEVRKEALVYIKENIFNNHLPLEKECFIGGDTPDALHCYYSDGWYYFAAGMGGGPGYYSKFLSCTPAENGRYLIGIESICYADDQILSKMTIDAALIEKDGLRMWKIYKVSTESLWNTDE